MKSLKPMFSRVGGKFYSRKYFINYFPIDIDTYIEPFLGAGSMFFYNGKKAKREIINDLDKDIYNIFLGVKSTPDFNERVNRNVSKEYWNSIKNSDNPIHIFERTKNSYFGIGTAFFHYPTAIGRTGITRTNFNDYYDRLKDVEIYNRNFKDMINEYGNLEKAFWYLDPPYSNTLGKKYYKYNSITPLEVFDLVKQIKGRFILSYNDSIEIRELFKDYIIEEINTLYACSGKNNDRRKVKELCIKNY